jgi:hypothetical protein
MPTQRFEVILLRNGASIAPSVITALQSKLTPILGSSVPTITSAFSSDIGYTTVYADVTYSTPKYQQDPVANEVFWAMKAIGASGQAAFPGIGSCLTHNSIVSSLLVRSESMLATFGI